jgi:glycosyltransferase involved in cell wall biosynthesis
VRILVLNQYFHPDRSATSQLLTELCEDLSQHHDVFVVTGRPSYNAAEGSASSGLVSKELYGRVRVARVWSTAFNRGQMLGRLTNYGTYVASSVAGAFAVQRPDVVVALTDPPPIGLIGAFAARLRGVPFVLVTKDIFPDVAVQLGALTNRTAIGALQLMKSTLLGSADRVVSIGRDMRARLLEAGVPAPKIVTIHDWSDGSAVRPLDSPSPLRIRRGWGDRFVVMHSGNVGLSQDLDTVIEAADRLRHHDDVLFAIVGEGASKARLQQAVADRGLDNVEFLPFQDKADLSESLGAADVHLVTLKRGLAGYIVPSKVYGILAAGKPFIAAVEQGSEPDLIVGEFGCGVRIEPGDPEALAETVLEMRDADLADLGKRGRKALEDKFDRPIAVGAYLDLLGTVVRDDGSTDSKPRRRRMRV